MKSISIYCFKPCSDDICQKIHQEAEKSHLKIFIEKEEKSFKVVIEGHQCKENGDFEPIDSYPCKNSQGGLAKISKLLYNYKTLKK